MKTQYSAKELLDIVKVDPVVVHYTRNHSEATLHAAECQHRAAEIGLPFSVTELLADDWFSVAPCAKRKPRTP